MGVGRSVGEWMGWSCYTLTPIPSYTYTYYSYAQVGGGMDGLFLSHANAYSLTYPGLNWQVIEEYTWITYFG